jgi:DNA processing protein
MADSQDPIQTNERLSLLALHFIDGIGSYLIKQLVSYCGSAEQVFKTPKGKLLKIPGIGAKTAEFVRTASPHHQAEKEFRKAEREEVDILFFTDKQFPSRLKTIEDAPSLLYLKGNINLQQAKTVGIVGTRQATVYGKEMVEKIITELVPHQPIIISGLAYGIDIHAHKQAIKNNLPTIGVMGSGMDIIYPAVHKETAKKMQDLGGLITENHFGTKPDAHNFPARNRIIAGLSDALIVIEAAEKGGALITAEIANSYNKDVFAVPGNIGQTYSEGCNKLIRTNKANLLTCVKDLEYIMNWTIEQGIGSSKTLTLFDATEFEPNEQKIIQLLREKNGPLTIDELSWKSKIQPSELASILLGLEFKNIIQSLPGKMYKLTR